MYLTIMIYLHDMCCWLNCDFQTINIEPCQLFIVEILGLNNLCAGYILRRFGWDEDKYLISI